MKAVVYHEYGSPDVLQLRDVEMSEPRPNELRIRMRVSKTPTAEVLPTLAELLEKRAFRPVIDRRYPLGNTADAIRYLEKGHACGKIVVEI